MCNNECIFCEIATKKMPAHIIWEDERHMAFLSIFPNTPGFTVVITKDHYPSYLFDLPRATYIGLLEAAKMTGLLLDKSFASVGRTGCFMEGFGVNHAHVKLSPMHGTSGEWRPIKSKVNKFFDVYEGYLSSHDHKRADDEELAALARHIRGFNKNG